tara:strand:- start:53 stop:505 length:453 start_codon:yes stop_codon:yes gene_type:complete
MKIIEKLSTYAALIGVIGAIGGGFYTWGQFNLRLDQIENKEFVVNETVDLAPIKDEVAQLKVELIDRIDEVEEQIQPVDLTSVFADIADVREKIAMIQIPNISGLKKDIKEITNNLLEIEKNIAIISKENEVQDLELEELKVKSNNPLAN